MGSSSMQHTIGSAIEQARQNGLFVEVLVDNHWLDGFVVESDGYGVILENAGKDRSVVRLERVTVVRVRADAPRLEIEDDTYGVVSDLAAPMPYPESTAV